MATLKHLASKSADYGKPIKYLMFEHDRNGTPLRDAEGNLIMRDSFILDGINCTPLSFHKRYFVIFFCSKISLMDIAIPPFTNIISVYRSIVNIFSKKHIFIPATIR